jgi:hypothetical protein
MEEYLLPQVQATFRTQAGTKALRSVSPKTPPGYTGVADAEKVKPRFEYRLLNLANVAPLSPATFNLKLRKLGLGYHPNALWSTYLLAGVTESNHIPAPLPVPDRAIETHLPGACEEAAALPC